MSCKKQYKHCILQTVKREMYRLSSGSIYLFCMIIAPLFCTWFYSSLMRSGLPKDMPVAVVDMDNSVSSRRLVRTLDALEQTQVKIRCQSFREARQAMQRGEVYGIFCLPKNFAVKAASGKQPQISFYINNSFLMAGSLLYKDMKTISVLASASVNQSIGYAKGLTEKQIMGRVQPIVLDVHPLGNPWLNYPTYLNTVLLPGTLEMLIFLVTVFSIGSEMKFNTSHSWLRMNNNSLPKALIGKLFPQTIIFTFIGFLTSSVLFGYNSVPLQSGWLPMLVAMLFMVIASQCIGILIISIVPTLRLALCGCCLFGILAFSLTGFTFPIQAMYSAFRVLAYAFPLRYYYLIYVDQALNGRALMYSWNYYIYLLMFFLLPLIVGKKLKYSLLHFKYLP
jgi:ABC-2 type transport system permease protein